MMDSPTPNPQSPTRPVVIKLGGAVLGDPGAVADVWAGVARLEAPCVVVHGGGPQATALARRLGHEPRVVAGRRVTTDLDLDVALWTMRGELNARLVASARPAGVRACGVSGIDGGTVTVEKRPPRVIDGETVDFGHVGDVVAVDARLLEALLAVGVVPVVAPLCADAAGAVFNVNADTVALAVAEALGAQTLLLAGEPGGVFRDLADPASLVPHLDAEAVAAGVAEGWIVGGMRPKLEAGLEALRRGIGSVRICAPAAIADASAGTVLVGATVPS